ncbi:MULTISPECIES: hypothetical protein [Roseomonadaceae]|uniref:DNA-directed DNA polymerase family A palm domain-containing protein n=1 Tax=Falsiroseomonas oleicola TaxID=2801474 RepID=A0ABS6H7W3_9PROT|nr:hypothetical protein [Roseomonas oleicola]MBU8544787.1 hypothetical protein [Roseomonas oleicola]
MSAFAPPPSGKPSAAALTTAKFLSLSSQAATPGAVALVSAVVEHMASAVDQDRQNTRREVGMTKLRGAVGAIVGGLLRHWSDDGGPHLAFRSLTKDSFTGAAVGFRQFSAAMDAMGRSGLAARAAGIAFEVGGFGPGDPASFARMAGRMWPSVTLLDLATAHGITPDNVRTHFVRVPSSVVPKVRAVVELRALSTGRVGCAKVKALVPLSPEDREAAALRHDVEAQNAFAEATPVTGCTPPRWRRIFHGSLALGGRWYASGEDSYQQMNGAARVSTILIAGEPTVEIDVRASLFTVLAGLAGQPLDPAADPYAVPGVPRAAVKAWVVASLGKGSPVVRWSDRALSEGAEGDPKALGAALTARYPFLMDPAAVVPDDLAEGLGVSRKGILPHLLTGLEARAMTAAMRELREGHGVLALPVHDSLIVPATAEGGAVVALRSAFVETCGAAGLVVRRAS